MKKINVHLSKELREKHKKRAFPVKKDDKVKIMRGNFAGTTGKVLSVSKKEGTLEIEGVQREKADGSKFNAKINASNVKLIEIEASDKWRLKMLKR